VLPAAIINHKTFCWDFSHLLVFRCLFFKFFNYFKCKWGNKFGCGLRGYSCAWSAKRSWRYVNENRSKKVASLLISLTLQFLVGCQAAPSGWVLYELLLPRFTCRRTSLMAIWHWLKFQISDLKNKKGNGNFYNIYK